MVAHLSPALRDAKESCLELLDGLLLCARRFPGPAAMLAQVVLQRSLLSDLRWKQVGVSQPHHVRNKTGSTRNNFN